MRVPAAILLAAGVFALASLMHVSQETVGQTPASVPVVTKWEYHTQLYNEPGNMNPEGEQGWELVAVVQQEPAHSGVIAYFKRPKR